MNLDDLRNDPSAAPLVRYAFHMAAYEGQSTRKIASYLCAHGICRADGRPLASVTVHALLHDQAHLDDGTVDPDTFSRVRSALAGRRRASSAVPDDEWGNAAAHTFN